MLGVPSAPKARSAKKSLTVWGTSAGLAIRASDCPVWPGERFSTNHWPPLGPLGSMPLGVTPTDGVPGGTWSVDGAGGGAVWAEAAVEKAGMANAIPAARAGMASQRSAWERIVGGLLSLLEQGDGERAGV